MDRETHFFGVIQQTAEEDPMKRTLNATFSVYSADSPGTPQTNTHMLEMELISPVLSNVLCFQTFPLQVSGKRQSDSLMLYKDTSLQNSLITV